MALFTNQAQLSYNNMIINSNIATGEILEVLSASKTAVSDNYRQNDRITYVISIVNTGSAPFSGLTVTDDLGAYVSGTQTLYPLAYAEDSVLVYVNGVLQSAEPTVSAGPPLVISDLTLPADSNMLIVYEATATQFAPLDTEGSIVNTVTVTASGLSSPITASESVSPALAADLTITKSIDPVPVAENARLTYTFTIQNYGNTPVVVTDDAFISDTFDPILSDLEVVFNGVTWAAAVNYTYDETAGLFSTIPGQITVPAASYSRDPATNAVVIDPGVSILTVTGTV